MRTQHLVLFLYSKKLQETSIFHFFTLQPTLVRSPLKIFWRQQRCKITTLFMMTQKKQKVTVCGFFFKELRLSETPPRWPHPHPTLRLLPCVGLLALRACCPSGTA